MLSRLNKLIARDSVFYVLILILASTRVISTKVKACPKHFDCESYLAMANSIQFDPAIAGHHAMRVLPSLLARGVHALGIDLTTAFQIVTGASFAILGMLVYWMLRRENKSPWVAFAFALICLAPHHAMNISLKLVYQACDMMTYPLTLLILYASFKKHNNGVFFWGIFGILTRQNLFILSELSLLYCYTQKRRVKTIVWGLLLAVEYFSLQVYYEATGVFTALLNPPAGFFTYSHIKHVILDSKVLELLVPLIPFIFFSFRALIKFFIENWHAFLYMCIVVGQPLLGYHLTGNNTQRIALQGVWVLFLACALTWPTVRTRAATVALVLYSLGIYFIWSMPQRLLSLMRHMPFGFVPQRL
jgi:hypothetical protein